jgi:glycogen phosphorylase
VRMMAPSGDLSMTIHHRPPVTPALADSVLERLTLTLGVAPNEAMAGDWFRATALAVRDRLVGRWHGTNRLVEDKGLKQVAYLSMEFLLARELENALMSTGLVDDCRAVLAQHGVNLDELMVIEPSPALGNGGLGRLAACFLDSTASIGLPCIGYGIRYEYGMFRQEIADGWQVERPDHWLDQPCPWEILRPERTYRVRFGGRVEHRGCRVHWVDTDDIMAVAHDHLIPGHGHPAVNTLRLWGVKPIDSFDLGAFNRGAFLDAQVGKVHCETLSRVLYPDDSTPEGRELRLRQEHLFVSASVQDLLASFRARHTDWTLLPEKLTIHLNETHPALAPAELMRLLVDDHELGWDDAWKLVRSVFSYTNHTLMPEALEVWPLALMRRVIPRHTEIIEEIDRRYLEGLRHRSTYHPGSETRVEIVEGGNRVNMGRLAVIASRRVNGVSKLHSDLLQEQLFPDFASLHPDRFHNVTNGITPRRWLAQANPRLSAVIDEAIGCGWRQNLEAIAELATVAEDRYFRARVGETKFRNKVRLAEHIRRTLAIEVDAQAMFDVHVKRIHEYKRQLLNIMGVIARWNAIRAEPGREWPARVVVFAGKAASAYWMAKLIIKLVHDVAERVNNDPETGDRLKVVFLPNYDVSLAEIIIPAAELSQQISLAGTEASGTGNMKLALNGALTVGTEDGANVEIAQAVGRDNIFLFGMTVDEVMRRKTSGYVARSVYEADPRLKQVVDQIAGGEFSPDDRQRFQPIAEALLAGNDPFFVLADFAAYWEAQGRVDAAWHDLETWLHGAVMNIAGAGHFSSDRTVRDYADRIWDAHLMDD